MKFGTLLDIYIDPRFKKNEFIEFQKIKSKKNDFQTRLRILESEIEKIQGLKDQFFKKYTQKKDIIDLSRWLLINQITVRKLIKKLLSDGLTEVPGEISEKINIFLQEKLDQFTLKNAKLNGTSPSGNRFERKSIKYLIPEIYQHLVIQKISEHLPVVRYKNEEGIPQNWTFIRSVYLDNENYELYSERLQKKPNSITLRYRKYDNMNQIFLERKKHSNELDENSVSTKERVVVINPDNQDFPLEIGGLSGNFWDTIQSRKLLPSLGISYSRISFGDEKTRVCFDNNIYFHMLPENILNCSKKNITDIVNFPIKLENSKDDKRFHFGILEVKITSTDDEPTNLPEWIEQMIISEWIIPVPKLSKFLTASYYLFDNQINILFPNQSPYWIPQISNLLDKYSPLNPYTKRNYSADLLIVPKGLRPEVIVSLDRLFLRRALLALKMILINIFMNKELFNLPSLLIAFGFFYYSIYLYYIQSRNIRERRIQNENILEKIILSFYFTILFITIIFNVYFSKQI